MQLSLQVIGFHRFLSGAHFIRIAADRIDFSVVYHKPVRMRSFPARICIRAEAGMNHRYSRFIVCILQIFKKHPQLSDQEHPLIDNCSA